jgi:hypothetical protein
MKEALTFVRIASATGGIALCAAAGVARLGGSSYILGFEGQSLFLAGIALMVLACLIRLEQKP